MHIYPYMYMHIYSRIYAYAHTQIITRTFYFGYTDTHNQRYICTFACHGIVCANEGLLVHIALTVCVKSI